MQNNTSRWSRLINYFFPQRFLRPEEADVLSSIWILSCNDDIPEMTYQSIKYRLGLPDDFDVKKSLQSRGELFRHKLPASRLDEWKQEMLKGNRLPSWIRNKSDKDEQKKSIDALESV